MRSNETSRWRFTSMPKLMARSSPSRSAVSFHASFRHSGRMTAKASSMPPTLGQVARDRLPIVQNTRFCRSSALAMNCISDTSALKVKTSAMPTSTMPEPLMPPQRASTSSSRAERMANTKALPATAHSAGSQGRLRSSTRASEAPKAAADEMPSVNGLASGLARMVCISAPARPRPRPTTTAMTA